MRLSCPPSNVDFEYVPVIGGWAAVVAANAPDLMREELQEELHHTPLELALQLCRRDLTLILI